MLDLRALRQDPEAARALLNVKGYDFDTERFDALEQQRKLLQSETETVHGVP